MANSILNQLTQKSSIGTGDLLYIVDVSDLTQGVNGTSKAITAANLLSGISSLSLSSPITVANGGTGLATLTSGSVLVGNGTSAISLVATTGSGNFVRATSPTLVTPTLGVATVTSLNGLTVTSSTGTLTIANSKTVTINNSLTLAGTDSTTITFPSTSDTVVTLGATQTLTNKTLTNPTIQQPWDGWVQATDTWTYASATSFTIAGVDRTAVFTKGTRLKLTNNSITVYAIVASSSFSTNTTVNLVTNSDYSLNNSAITNPFYSYQVNPQGYPTWFNFTTTITNQGGAFTNNPTVNFAKISAEGSKATVRIGITFNATSGGTGYVRATLSLSPAANFVGFGSDETNNIACAVAVVAAGPYLQIQKYDGTTIISNSLPIGFGAIFDY